MHLLAERLEPVNRANNRVIRLRLLDFFVDTFDKNPGIEGFKCNSCSVCFSLQLQKARA